MLHNPWSIEPPNVHAFLNEGMNQISSGNPISCYGHDFEKKTEGQNYSDVYLAFTANLIGRVQPGFALCS